VLPLLTISTLSLNQNSCGSGSALILHSKHNLLPSASGLIVGFLVKFGAIPSCRLKN